MRQEVQQGRNHPAVLITGASSGIGQGCALYLDKLYYSFFADVRKEQDALALTSNFALANSQVITGTNSLSPLANPIKTIGSETDTVQPH
jgi:NADP-dependent 3-hydroxy acid dehydrogenase YdfG